MESIDNTDYFVDNIVDTVSRVTVVNPRRLKLIACSVKETDKHNAETLTYFLNESMPPESRHKSSNHRKVHGLSQMHDELVKLRTYFINNIRGLFNHIDIKLKKSGLGKKVDLRRIGAYELNDAL